MEQRFGKGHIGLNGGDMNELGRPRGFGVGLGLYRDDESGRAEGLLRM